MDGRLGLHCLITENSAEPSNQSFDNRKVHTLVSSSEYTFLRTMLTLLPQNRSHDSFCLSTLLFSGRLRVRLDSER